ncbi:MAG: hypothetical protein WCK89_14770 [bacterium]
MDLKQIIALDDLQVPEVVKPKPTKVDLCPRKNDRSLDTVIAQPLPGISDKGEEAQRVGTSTDNREKSNPQSPRPVLTAHDTATNRTSGSTALAPATKKTKTSTAAVPAKPTASTAQSPPPTLSDETTKSPSSNVGWIVGFVITGILVMIGFVVFNGSIPENKDPLVSSVVPVEPVQVSEQPVVRLTPGDTPMVPQKPSVILEDPVSTQPPAPPVLPKPPGAFQLSAYAVDTEGQRHSITGLVSFELGNNSTSFNLSTNYAIPCLWLNIPSGNHRLSITAIGYQPFSTNNITFVANTTNECAIALQPLPAKVRFTFPTNAVTFEVFNDVHLLGTSEVEYDLTPFVTHYLTFKANGWRDKRVSVQLPDPGVSYDCFIDAERVECGFRVTVITQEDGKPPASGLISVNGSAPVELALPYERSALHYTGPLTLVLSVEGYQVLNSTQQVVLVDREMTNVVFSVERNSWISRLLQPSARRHIKE